MILYYLWFSVKTIKFNIRKKAINSKVIDTGHNRIPLFLHFFLIFSPGFMPHCCPIFMDSCIRILIYWNIPYLWKKKCSNLYQWQWWWANYFYLILVLPMTGLLGKSRTMRRWAVIPVVSLKGAPRVMLFLKEWAPMCEKLQAGPEWSNQLRLGISPNFAFSCVYIFFNRPHGIFED